MILKKFINFKISYQKARIHTKSFHGLAKQGRRFRIIVTPRP